MKGTSSIARTGTGKTMLAAKNKAHMELRDGVGKVRGMACSMPMSVGWNLQ